MEYATRHSYFPYTHEPLGECVYEENTSDKKIFGNLRKCSEIFGKFPDVIGNVCNGSQELKSSELASEKSSNGPQ